MPAIALISCTEVKPVVDSPFKRLYTQDRHSTEGDHAETTTKLHTSSFDYLWCDYYCRSCFVLSKYMPSYLISTPCQQAVVKRYGAR